MRIVIAGGGETGTELAIMLSSLHEVVVIEHNPTQARMLTQYVDGQIIQGDTTSLQTILALDPATVDLFVAATGVDEINILACITAKRLGTTMVAACVKNRDYWEGHHLLEKELAQINLLLHPIFLTAKEVVRQILEPCLVAKTSIASGHLTLQSLLLAHDSPLVEQKLKEVSLPAEVRICALTRAGKTAAADDESALAGGDLLHMLGESRQLSLFVGKSAPLRLPQRILIGGGAELAEEIALLMRRNSLEKDIILINANEKYCEKLAEKIPQLRFFVGNLTDKHFFSSIVKGKTDLFIAADENNQRNVITALIAKSVGIKTIVAVVKDKSCQVALRAAGIQNNISSTTLTAVHVYNLLHQGKEISLTFLGQGPNKILECKVTKGMPIIGSRFAKDQLPDNAIWCALARNNVLLPTAANERVQAGDYLLLLLPEEHNAACFSLFSHRKAAITYGRQLKAD